MILFAYARLRHEFAALVALQPRVGEVPDAETVHQLRVAARRLRGGLRLFRHMLPGDAVRHFNDRFRSFARALGEVRDLDVYAENLAGYARMLPPEQLPQLAAFELHLRGRLAEARGNLRGLFSRPDVAALIAEFAAFLDEAPTPAALRRWRSFRVRDGVPEYLAKGFRRTRRIGRKAQRDRTPEHLHRLRVSAKRLRYELEFFTDIYPALKDAIKSTKRLQEVLGQHQDACTATVRLREYTRVLAAGGDGTAPPPAIDRLLMVQEQWALRTRDRLAAEWRRFERTVGGMKLTMPPTAVPAPAPLDLE